MTDHSQPDFAEDDDDNWSQWPLCPGCEAKRQTFCPYCKSAGTHFHLADYIPATRVHQIGSSAHQEPTFDEKTALLMCDVCDEAFSPRFYARCQNCGHEFADGIRIENAVRNEFSGRALIVLFSLLTLLFLLLGLFVWILR